MYTEKNRPLYELGAEFSPKRSFQIDGQPDSRTDICNNRVSLLFKMYIIYAHITVGFISEAYMNSIYVYNSEQW